MTPYEKNFKVPGRFEHHECTFITWPCKDSDLEIFNYENEIAIFAEKLSKFEKVVVIADPSNFEKALKKCKHFALIWSIPTDFSWIRDNGPIFIKNDKAEVAGVHFKFNGWGNKFEKCESIKELPKILLEKLKIKRFTSDLILEGGGVSFDGQGTMITTEQMLMHKNRNAAFSKLQIEKEVRDLLGIQKVIWLKKGLVEDEGTDGHVDCVAEYLAPQKVLAQTVYDKNNPNYELLKINLEILKAENDAQGNKLEIIEMPYLPYFPQLYKNTQYVSPYTNYYVANNSVLVPEVDPKLDEKAYNLIQDIYADRTIVPIPAFYQAIGGGGPGCITQQLPKGINTSV
ncbi:agmatine deiminase family protein [Alphaproteobacteria bacterium]|nr:agmatine deiminase family protein [Alphaproteobacteria bacterium]